MATSNKLPPPLIAGAGFIDLVAQKLQEYGPKLQQKAAELPGKAQRLAADLKEKARATDTDALRTSAAGIKESAGQTMHTVRSSARSFYDQMLARGERLMAERQAKNGKRESASKAPAKRARKTTTTKTDNS